MEQKTVCTYKYNISNALKASNNIKTINVYNLFGEKRTGIKRNE